MPAAPSARGPRGGLFAGNLVQFKCGTCTCRSETAAMSTDDGWIAGCRLSALSRGSARSARCTSRPAD